MEFPIPKNVNGEKISQDLEIELHEVFICEDKLIIKVDPSRKSEVEAVLAKYN